MTKTRRISALACVAALTAGAYAVPSANAATVGAPRDGVCALSLTDGERSYLQSLPRIDQADYATTLTAQAFEAAFPAAAEEGKEVSDNYVTWATRFGDNPDATTNEWVKRLSATGVDESAARFYFGYLLDSALVEVHASPALLKFWEQVDQAKKTGTITASAGDGVSDVPEFIPSNAEFAENLKKAHPSMPAAQRNAWATAYAKAPGTIDAQRVAAYQAAFTQARIMCGLGGGEIALPSNTEQGVTYSATPSKTQTPTKTTTITDGNTKVTVTASVNVSSFADKEITPVTPTGTKTVEPAAGKVSGTNVGAIIGIIAAILAVVGIGGAAFAMTR